jgi:hypothetical protein
MEYYFHRKGEDKMDDKTTKELLSKIADIIEHPKSWWEENEMIKETPVGQARRILQSFKDAGGYFKEDASK